MGIVFRQETFRDDFTFRNSAAGIRRFPFPFDRDDYMYAVNIEPHVKGRPETAFESLIDVDEHYVAEMHDRALVLKEDPLRCQSLPHMALAGWDLSGTADGATSGGLSGTTSNCIATAIAGVGSIARWASTTRFTFGDESTLPFGPMEYITRQAQGDFCLLDQRNDNLWMDAGIVTTQADWSLDFDIGMNFMEWHAPVPRAHEMGRVRPCLEVHAEPAPGLADKLEPGGIVADSRAMVGWHGRRRCHQRKSGETI